MKPLIISAPFGNYVQPVGATPTLGTFTAERRPGRWWRALRTVRYYPRIGAWVNQIGLRNPGMAWLAERVQRGRIDVSDKIVSVHGFTPEEWGRLLERAAELRPLAIELNMSCPNIGRADWPQWLFERAARLGLRAIVKLPPVNYREMVESAMAGGIGAFHCCNTIPVPRGGVSGKPLKPVALQCIGDVLRLAHEGARSTLIIIGGGGITTPADIDDYAAAGARHVALGTRVMNPLHLLSHAGLRPLIEHAERRLGPRGA